MDKKERLLRADVESPEILMGIGLEDRETIFRYEDASQLKGRSIAFRPILGGDFRRGRKRTVGSCPFVHVALHVEKRRVPHERGFELHGRALRTGSYREQDGMDFG